MSRIQYAGHIWINRSNMEDINNLWYKLIKTAVGATFNIGLGIGEVILGVPPIAIQTAMNQTKHYLKLNIKKAPEDMLRCLVSACMQQEKSLPPELSTAIKEVFKFLTWKLAHYTNDFTEEDKNIITNKELHCFFNLSPKSCSYTKCCINNYTEIVWLNKLRNQGLMNGEPHVPKPRCSKIPIPINTQRDQEVLLLSLFYPQNLMNSFVYRHTYCAESPLCPQCNMNEQTPYHVICECNQYKEELQQVIIETVGEDEYLQRDSITLLNCSREPRFIHLCLQVLQEGDFRTKINLDQRQ